MKLPLRGWNKNEKHSTRNTTQQKRSIFIFSVRSSPATQGLNLLINASKMVCIACLLPLFLVPIVNLLPLLFDFIMAKVYRLFGWEYRKPERAPPACPYRPPANKVSVAPVKTETELLAPDSVPGPFGTVEGKQD